MFHEPYVELIDNNGNNPNEVEKLWKKKHTDQTRWFCFASVLGFFFLLKKAKDQPDFLCPFYHLRQAIMAPEVLTFAHNKQELSI